MPSLAQEHPPGEDPKYRVVVEEVDHNSAVVTYYGEPGKRGLYFCREGGAGCAIGAVPFFKDSPVVIHHEDLLPDTEYVAMIMYGGGGGNARQVNFRTEPAPQCPCGSWNLRLEDKTANSATLKWDSQRSSDVRQYSHSYTVTVRTASHTGTDVTAQVVNGNGWARTKTRLTNLQEGTTYYVTVKYQYLANNAIVNGGSAQHDFTTFSRLTGSNNEPDSNDEPAPSSVIVEEVEYVPAEDDRLALTVTQQTDSSVSVQWTILADAENYTLILTDGDDLFQVEAALQGTNTMTFSGLPADTALSVAVYAYDGAGVSVDALTISTRTLAAASKQQQEAPTAVPPTPVPPTNTPVPPTPVPPTPVPPTPVPPTPVPPTPVPPTPVPASEEEQPSYQVPDSLISTLLSYEAETEGGAEHVGRWTRALAALGHGSHADPVTASEAQVYVNRGWTRWVPVLEALKKLGR